jgi:predicted nucleic acid-binding protein
VILDTNALSAFIDGEPAVGAAVTEPTTLLYARVRASLKKIGRPIPANDAWIAALAIQHRRPVFSRDQHFDDVPGLRRESW